ncbi:hypothetical protein RM844_28575 [Streptomyces sp. DSM 44915]|uniref:Ribbon-helix-helix domain-containing protein n=1 Tax=Streptomyces chisholmiae TaxID=3075540 RepID=A0ABU2JZH0_9ACTN|nr:hypothetical protein [Streptomyces sp. DSM 44915]MDT0270232.1 hypothetical protein [Streptomyces sp. DSM 44915]
MPNAEKTPRQTVRIEAELWSRAGEMLGPGQRSAAIRDFLRWLTHETDQLPERPERPGGESAGPPL